MIKIKQIFLALIMLFINLNGYSQSNLPRVNNLDDQIIYHTSYTLSYNETHEQANWVRYMVTKTDLENSVAKRKNNFKEDKSIKSGSAQLVDYKGSGYDRGHLAPAATFVDSQIEMDESFYMSNMTPQHPSFNRGIWKKLETYERKSAMDRDTIYVICGPVLTDNLKTIGPNRVSIPKLYFKILYTEGWRMCFIMKNEKSNEPLYMFKHNLDIVQKESKINFMLK